MACDDTGLAVFITKVDAGPITTAQPTATVIPDIVPPEAGGPIEVAPPTMQPTGGTFPGPQRITMTAPAGTIHYTADGSTPTETSPVYSEPITVSDTSGDDNGTTTTILSIAVVNGQTSQVVRGTFTIQTPHSLVWSPAIKPNSGSYDGGVDVSMSVALPSTICYTLDDSAPTCTRGNCTGTTLTYDGGSVLLRGDAGTRVDLKAQGCRVVQENSEITTATYTF
jgi:hypothetical protein